jgi:hypothetical protein
MKLNLLLSVALAGLVSCDSRSSTESDDAAKSQSAAPSATRKLRSAARSAQAKKDPAPGVMAGGIEFPPAGRYKADLLSPATTPEAEAIGLKLQQAMAADPAWFQSYLQEAGLEPGQLLPYHEKMGITEEEYAAVLEAAKSMGLKKLSDAYVSFAEAQGRLTMHIEGVALPTYTFVFSSGGQEMKCTLGSSAAPTAINQKDESSPAGAWKGSQWVVTKGNPEQALKGAGDVYELKVAIGKDTMERNLIYLRIAGRRSRNLIDLTYLLRWPQ